MEVELSSRRMRANRPNVKPHWEGCQSRPARVVSRLRSWMLPIVLLKLLLNPFENLFELLPSGSYTENTKMDQTSRKSAPPARQTPLDN